MIFYDDWKGKALREPASPGCLVCYNWMIHSLRFTSSVGQGINRHRRAHLSAGRKSGLNSFFGQITSLVIDDES